MVFGYKKKMKMRKDLMWQYYTWAVRAKCDYIDILYNLTKTYF